MRATSANAADEPELTFDGHRPIEIPTSAYTSVWSTSAELAPSAFPSRMARADIDIMDDMRMEGLEIDTGAGKGKAKAVDMDEFDDDLLFGNPASVPIAMSWSAQPSSSSYSYSASYSYASSSSPYSPCSFSFSPMESAMQGDDGEDIITPATSYDSYQSTNSAGKRPEGLIAQEVHEPEPEANVSVTITAVTAENDLTTLCTIQSDVDQPATANNTSTTNDDTNTTINDDGEPDTSTNSTTIDLTTHFADPIFPSHSSPVASPTPEVLSRPPSRPTSHPNSRPRSLSSISFAFSLSSNTSNASSSKLSLSRLKSSIRDSVAGRNLLRKRSRSGSSSPRASSRGEGSSSSALAPPAEVPQSILRRGPNKGKGKMRAFSSPLPYVLATHSPPLSPELTVGVSEPFCTIGPLTAESGGEVVEAKEVKAYFDDLLPRELQLQVFKNIVVVCEEEHARDIRDGAWTVARASSERWVGKTRGVREIVKLSRVSRAWRALALDGQLWRTLDFSAFPALPPASISSVVRSAGPFIKHVHLGGFSRLYPPLARALVPPFLPHTQLRTLNLRGCRAIATGPLHALVVVSPLLEKIDFSALTAVTNYTCNLLATWCPRLQIVNLNRCPYLSGAGIIALAIPTGTPPKMCQIRELRASGLRHANTGVMSALARYVPELVVLDLSGARHLADDAIEAFIECSATSACEKIALTARQAGHDPADPTTYYRRLTKLRHLALSSCPDITDQACSQLAHAVPQLEFLELADLGGAMRDDGLVRLLETTPLIRRVDLDDAMDITDRVLDALTPAPPEDNPHPRAKPRPPQPGERLEMLILSYATNLSNDAVLMLIRSCPRLRVLELDNTRISDAVVREFVRTLRRRKVMGGEIVAVDCRSVGKNVVTELAHQTRPRRGWKAWEAQPMGYDDGSPADYVGSLTGQDECDESKVVLKSFWSWQTVDTAAALRERRRRLVAGGRRFTEGDMQLSRIGRNAPDANAEPGDIQLEDQGADSGRGRRYRWIIRWSTGRPAALAIVPEGVDAAAAATAAGGPNNDDRSCVIM